MICGRNKKVGAKIQGFFCYPPFALYIPPYITNPRYFSDFSVKFRVFASQSVFKKNKKLWFLIQSLMPLFLVSARTLSRRRGLAKLKRNKLDVRREQWLSQVKSKGTNVASNEWGRSSPQISVVTDEGNKSSKSSVLDSKEVDIEVSSIQESDLTSLMSSPVGSSNLPGSSCCSASSSCCSGSVSETEEDNGCLDDWEAVADALIATEKHHEKKREPSARSTNNTRLADPEYPYTSSDISLQEKENRGIVSRAQENSRAWRADNASRPQCLPNLLKQNNQKNMSSCGAKNYIWQSIVSQPSSCPICYEDLDLTDSSFLPCPCGFSLCLFFHKRILEADARCAGCRKQYDHINADIGTRF